MWLDKVLATNIPNLSYVQAGQLIISGNVRVGKKCVNTPWLRLRSGHYFVAVAGYGVYKFSVRQSAVHGFKAVQ